MTIAIIALFALSVIAFVWIMWLMVTPAPGRPALHHYCEDNASPEAALATFAVTAFSAQSSDGAQENCSTETAAPD